MNVVMQTGGTRKGAQELRQFHRRCDRVSAAWRIAAALWPIVSDLWRYYRNRGGLPVVDAVTRDREDAAQ